MVTIPGERISVSRRPSRELFEAMSGAKPLTSLIPSVFRLAAALDLNYVKRSVVAYLTGKIEVVQAISVCR